MSDVRSALLLIGELEDDLDAHVHQEGEEVELRTQNGGWVDIRDRIERIKEALA